MTGRRGRALAVLGLLLLLAPGCRQRLISPPAGPADLVRAYPDHVAAVDASHVVLRDGTRLPLSDGIEGKTPAQRILRPDLDDMFAQPSRPGRPRRPPAADEDPGRARYEPFFDAV